MKLTEHNRLMYMQGNAEQGIGFWRLSRPDNLPLGQIECERKCTAPFDVQLMLMLNTGANSDCEIAFIV